ncbi:putative membrane protein [Sesbania bispinosa]|nr:putative membrane protein [Sesbania bispinosa]
MKPALPVAAPVPRRGRLSLSYCAAVSSPANQGCCISAKLVVAALPSSFVVVPLLLSPRRKDARKILKRKDSDAGEKGRALEDLRTSLFNQFRSSEGAKRQQQRICGPATALSFNFLVAVLQTVQFKFPILLTLIHYVVSWFLMAVLKAFSFLPAPPSSKSTQMSTLFTLGFVMSLSTGLANVSLKYNRKKVSLPKALALTVVSIGVAVATVTDLQFHLFGACVALAWIVPSAVNKILWSRLQQQESWTALSLMWKTTPITLIFLAAMLPCLDPPGVLSFNWNFSNTLVIFTSAILGFLLQWSGFSTRYLRLLVFYNVSNPLANATSAISHVVLGQFKTCVLLLGNYYLFGSNPGKISICGAFTAIAGMSVYTYLNLRQQSNKISPRQASTLKI